MNKHIFFFISMLFCCVSCSYFSSETKKELQQLDTIINFSKVDTSPSFKNCTELIDQEKTNCFRENIHKKITNSLRFFSFSAKESINETIIVFLLIDEKGEVSLQKIESSDFVKKEIPDLLLSIKSSIDSLPTLQPAIKRGIPVATQYKLPIQIRSK